MDATAVTQNRPLLPSNVPIWAQSPEALAGALGSGPQGLSLAEAEIRRKTGKPGRIVAQESGTGVALLVSQFKSPVTILMIVAAIISIGLGERIEGGLILLI